ncbi:MAG: sigma-70 family RNA polymerase sigma factor [Planctomycetota bacterium]
MARPEILFDRYRRRGDLAALGAVFERTAPELLRIAMHFAHHPAEAEDLLQETFLTAIVRADAFDATRPLVPWLVGILRNHARVHGRRGRRAAGLEGAQPEPVDVSADAWMDVAWSGAIGEIVETLPDPYRQVLVLRLRHDRTPVEIAMLLDLSPATVRSQIHRGLDLLRRRLPPDRRSPVLAALPLGAGLAAVKERVLAHGAQLAVAPVAGAIPLVLGGLAMKKALVAAGVLVALTTTLTTVWVSGRDSSPPGTDTTTANAPSEPRSVQRPALVGTPLPVAANGEARRRDTGDALMEGPWPPDLPIPADKGSVAGRIRFSDGTPLVGARIALWGSSKVVGTTDAQGRFHVHADWVGPRSVYLRLGRDDQPDYLGLILSSQVAMRAGELVMRDIELDRGIDLESRVVDGYTGKPLEGVKVVLRRQPLGGLQQARSGFLETDVEGRFRFPYVPHAGYTLALSREGYQAVQRTFELPDDALPAELSIDPSQVLQIQFQNLPDGAVGTEVRCDLARTDGSYFSVSFTRTIERDGSLRLDAPEPGTYHMTVFRSSHLPRLERDLTVPEGRLAPVIWRLAPSARVVGTVSDHLGEPLAGARVDIGTSSAAEKTKADGSFEIPYVPAGTQTARVRVDGASVVFGSVEVAAGVARIDLRAPGSAAIDVRVLVAGVPLDATHGGVSVRDAKGAEVASARPEAGGKAHVPLLAAGSYDVLVWSGSAEPYFQEVQLPGGQRMDLGTVDLRALQKVPLRLVVPRGSTLSPSGLAVRVLDPDTGEALALRRGTMTFGVMAYVSPDDEHADRAWVSGLPARHVRLELSSNDFRPATLDVEVKPGLTEPFEVRFEPK